MFVNTKERIFHSAIDMFSSVGYSESTMRELASRVGIKASSLYHHYPSKDALLDEILDFFIEKDIQCRIPVETIISKSKELTVSEILHMMFVKYGNDTDLYFSLKILKIAVGYQFEYRKAREVFEYIFFGKGLNYRKTIFSKLIDCKILEPFDYSTVSYTLTAYSMMRLIDSINNNLPMDEYANAYFEAIEKIIMLISNVIKKVS